MAKPILNPRVKQFFITRVEIGPIGMAIEMPSKIDLRKRIIMKLSILSLLYLSLRRDSVTSLVIYFTDDFKKTFFQILKGEFFFHPLERIFDELIK